MKGYLAELAGIAAALLLLTPTATAPLPGNNATAPTTGQEAVDWSNCLACHPQYASDLPRLSQIRPAGFSTTLEVDCTTCHGQAELLQFPSDWLHPVRPVGAHVSCTACHPSGAHSAKYPPELPTGDYSSEGCYSCHSDVKLDFAASIGHDDHPAVRCKACHPPHESLMAGIPANLVSPGAKSVWLRNYDWYDSNLQCLNCHQPGELFFFTNQGGFSTLNTVNYHEQHVVAGQVLCIECHNPHGGSREAFIRKTLLTGEVLTFYREMDGGTCAVNCHNVQHDYWKYTNTIF